MLKALRNKINYCDELISFCELLINELNYSANSIPIIIKKSKINLDVNCLSEKTSIDTVLSKEENDRLSDFVYSLGKSDKNTQINIVNSFLDYIKNIKNNYQLMLQTKSKIYISFGVCSGIILSLILI